MITNFLKIIIENTFLKITSKNNNLVKRFRSFKRGSSPKDQDFFCIEGTHLIEELLKSGKNPSKILVTEKWLRKNQNLSKKFHQSLINIVSEEVLASAISTINPDGIAALVEISAIPNYQFNRKDDFVLVLDRIQDPGNICLLYTSDAADE